jgi:hypothetical protein
VALVPGRQRWYTRLSIRVLAASAQCTRARTGPNGLDQVVTLGADGLPWTANVALTCGAALPTIRGSARSAQAGRQALRLANEQTAETTDSSRR